jgi:hypothetical protein
MTDSKKPKDKVRSTMALRNRSATDTDSEQQQEKKTISQKPNNLSSTPESADSTAQKRKAKDDVEPPSKKSKATYNTLNEKTDNRNNAVSSSKPVLKIRKDWRNFFLSSSTAYRAKTLGLLQESAAAAETDKKKAEEESRRLDDQINLATKIRDQVLAIKEVYNKKKSSLMAAQKELQTRNDMAYKLYCALNGDLVLKNEDEEETGVMEEVDEEHGGGGDQSDDEDDDDPVQQWLAEIGLKD